MAAPYTVLPGSRRALGRVVGWLVPLGACALLGAAVLDAGGTRRQWTWTGIGTASSAHSAVTLAVRREDRVGEYLGRDSLYPWRVVGIPKRGSDDSRPICIASVIARAWHSLVFAHLPPAVDGQFAEKGVVRGTAVWAAAVGNAGAEIDLAKAYDSVNLGAAAEALRYQGVPEEVVAMLQLAWTSPRICNVEGRVAEVGGVDVDLPEPSRRRVCQ